MKINKKHKKLSLILLLASLTSYNAFAATATFDDVVNAINQQGQALKDAIDASLEKWTAHFTGSEIKKNQADAELAYEAAPGTKVGTSKVKEIGTQVKSIDSQIETVGIIKKKSIEDMDHGMFLKTFNEQNPDIANPDTHIASNHFNNQFCSDAANFNLGGLSSLLPGSKKACENSNVNLTYSDINIGSFLDKSSITPAEQSLVSVLIRNVVNPSPRKDAKEAVITDPKLGKTDSKEKVAVQLSEMANLSPAYNSLNHAYRIRLPLEVVDSNGAKLQKSILQLYEEEADRRFANSTWYDEIDKASPEALAREQLHIAAFRAKLELERYKQEERKEAIMASLLSINVQAGKAADVAFATE